MFRIKFPRCLLLSLTLLALGTLGTFGQIIPSGTTIDWTHVGVRGGIVARPNSIDVTQSPYNADKTGTTDATAAIQAAINAATSNSVVYFPDGKYLIDGSLSLAASYITLRGHTNSTLVGVGGGGAMLVIGHPGDEDGAVTDYIGSGSTNGSTQITLTTTPSFSVGDLIGISQNDVMIGTANLPIMNVHQYNYNIQQEVIVTAISGNTVTLSDPLLWNFTNTPVVLAAVGGVTKSVGVENLIFSTKNTATGGTGSYSFTIEMYDCYDSWVTNCSVLYSFSYAWSAYYSSHLTLFGNTIRYSQGSGADHSGLLTQSISGCLVANNIMADGLQPALEFDQGTTGNAFFANFFTNNIIDVDNHGPHPFMNLWEENKLGGYFEMDGYFGSGSHQTLLRDVVGSTYIPLLFKRWTTHMNVVGNVLGSPGVGYPQYTSTANNPAGAMIIQSGYPNIGNNSYTATSVAPAWNYPLSSYPNGDSTGLVYPSPVYTFTSNQGPTSVLSGNFANIVGTMISLAGSVYTLVIQDNNNTNLYYPTNGTPLKAVSTGTTTSLALNQNVTIKAGMSLYVSGQNGYQQLQTNDLATDTISGNYDYYNNAVTWNGAGAQAIPTSLIYTNGKPSWWGTNRWPAIDPLSSPLVATIPAEYSYVYGTTQPGGTNAPASPQISVTPGSQNFGSVVVGNTASLPFAVQNSGGGTLTGSVASVSAPFNIASGKVYSLAAGQSTNVMISYSPTVTGSNLQTATFSGGAGASVVISGTAITTVGAQISVTPTNWNFGMVYPLTTTTQSLVVSNAGVGTLIGSGSVAAPFSIVGGGTYSLAPGQSTNVMVSYSPTVEGESTQAVAFSGGGGAQATLAGTAIVPAPGSLLTFKTTNSTPNNPPGLVGWWKFIETSGNIASDSSGNSNTGTAVGSPVWESPGLLLNGSSQYAAITPNHGLPLYSTAASNNVTVSLWVYLENTSSEQVFYSEGASSGSGRFFIQFNNSSNPGKILVCLPSTCSPARLPANTTLLSKTWYNIVWTDHNGTGQLYINGSPDGASFNYTPSASGSTSGIAIGSAYDGVAGDTFDYTEGILTDVRLWNNALNSSQVSAIYIAGRATQ